MRQSSNNHRNMKRDNVRRHNVQHHNVKPHNLRQHNINQTDRPLRGNMRQKAPRVPISEVQLAKHLRGSGVDLGKIHSDVKSNFQRKRIAKKEKVIQDTIEETARAELLLTEEHGYLESDPGERTIDFRQKQIANNVDITSATKSFSLDLQFGSYSMRYTRNGRHLVLGGRKGHVAAFDWVTKTLACEMNVMESVHDVTWLHVPTMFAAAQKDWVYIYDHQGIELHCLKQMNAVNRLEFLPYHFLLASAAKTGCLTWVDVSIGECISRFNSGLGCISVMTQNPSNAVLCVGNSKGVISLWSPNTQKPLAKMLCHTQNIMACAVNPHGTYMATSSVDRSLKVWDIRQLAGPLSNTILRSGAHHLSYSQRGLLALAMGNVVEVYRDSTTELKAYLRHKTQWTISSMQFCPYEDVLGLGTAKGFTSLLVPGSGEANYDALEANPFQSKKQRREAEVKALLEKIQPDLITLDPTTIAEVDVPTLQDKVEARKKVLYLKPKKINFEPRRSKAKGKGGTAKIIKVKNILKNLNKRDFIQQTQAARKEERETNDLSEASSRLQESFGVLNRFVPKKK